ncbi:GerW family sporulation protein [Haloarchaeobius sp. HME9146]|uniref:GerW family sporulation protein n=1 Tax=unclassified Haloarchaeobius TaxID=2614452 RepID=UPI0021BF985C|nr:spore germination protein GerW family protein [Haloarchaeobius sp. HME9146]MCT9096008.1 spore germination protein GerW family protein [Haloarchaeobius sp. HME9146]
MQFSETLQATVENLRDSAHVRTVYGDPVEHGDRTVVPVARVAYGYGGGFGSGDGTEGSGSGGGYGGGVVSTPVGALDISDGETRFVRFDERRNVARGVLAGLVVGAVLAGTVLARVGSGRRAADDETTESRDGDDSVLHVDIE